MEYLAIVFGIILLIKGGDWLLEAAISLSLRLNIPKIVIGMTIVSFATSAPELIVSVNAALNGYSDLALGNVVGSNVANLAFVLGVVLVVSPIDVPKAFYKTDWPMMFIATLLFYFFIIQDSILSQWEGGVMVIILVLFLIILLFFQGKETEQQALNFTEFKPIGKTLLSLSFGGFCLWLGAEVLIKGAVTLAKELGVSERVISITVVSVGTSIPELSASLIAIINKEKAISIGNLIGSNLFNILAVMGITSVIAPIVVEDQNLLQVDFPWMIFVSAFILPLVILPKKMQLGRRSGILLLIFYLLFIFKMFL
ncbi:MAG: calcium/sodium antiporter [Flavobacteriaceae bacterium]